MLALLAIPSALGYATCAADFPAFTATTAGDVTELQLRLEQNEGVDGLCIALVADLTITSSMWLTELEGFGAPTSTAICAGGHTISIEGATVSIGNEFVLRDAVVNMSSRGTAEDFRFLDVSGTYDSQDNTYNGPNELLSGKQYKHSANLYTSSSGSSVSLSNDVVRGGGTLVRVRHGNPLITTNCTFYATQKAVQLDDPYDDPPHFDDHSDPTSKITYCAAGSTRLPSSECQPCIKPPLCGAPPDASMLIPFPGDQCVYEKHVGSNCAACMPGSFRSPTGSCEECPSAPLQLILGIPIYLIMLGFVYAISKTPSSDGLTLFTISTINLQMLGVLFSLEGMHFPQLLIDFNVNLELAFNFKFLSWMCMRVGVELPQRPLPPSSPPSASPPPPPFRSPSQLQASLTGRSSPECGYTADSSTSDDELASSGDFNERWLMSILPVLLGQILFAVLACTCRSKARKTQAMRAFWQVAT